MVRGGRWRDEFVETASVKFYEVVLPVISAGRWVKPIYEAYLMREYNPVSVDISDDKRVGAVTLFHVGSVRPAVIGLYIYVAKEPLKPSKYKAVVARLSRFVNSVAPQYRDSYLAVVAERWSDKSMEMFRETRVGVRTVEEARRDIMNWFLERVAGLARAMYGKTVFGKLIINAYLWALVVGEYLGNSACRELRTDVEMMALSKRGVEANKFFDWLLSRCCGTTLSEAVVKRGRGEWVPPPIVEDAVAEASRERSAAPASSLEGVSSDACPEDAYYISGHCFPVVVEGEPDNDDDYFYVGGYRFRVREID